jgi:hypothetical protein
MNWAAANAVGPMPDAGETRVFSDFVGECFQRERYPERFAGSLGLDACYRSDIAPAATSPAYDFSLLLQGCQFGGVVSSQDMDIGLLDNTADAGFEERNHLLDLRGRVSVSRVHEIARP